MKNTENIPSNPPAPTQSGSGVDLQRLVRCFECEEGILRTVLLPYETTNGRGELLIVPAVPHEVCDKCGDTCFRAASSRMIEAARVATGVKYKRRKLSSAKQPDNPDRKAGGDCSATICSAGARVPSLERGCKGKIKLGRNYEKRADKLSTKHGKRYGVYNCPHCGGYHLTTKLDKVCQYAQILHISEPNV